MAFRFPNLSHRVVRDSALRRSRPPIDGGEVDSAAHSCQRPERLRVDNPSYCPRAWVVHDVIAERSKDLLLRRIAEPAFDPMRTAFVREALDIESDNSGLEGSSQNSKPAEVAFESYGANSLELSVNTG